MKSITDLPDQDLYPSIFRNLSIQDLFNCRLVNKKFKYFSDHTDGIDRLIIGQPVSFSYCYYNEKLIENKEIISLKCFRSIKSLSIFNLDKYLKYLKIYDQELKSEDISNLINLESFELCYHFGNRVEQIINSKNLKFFASNCHSNKLNTPELEKIQFDYYINEIKFDSNPKSIKHLITEKYHNKIEMFKNLEIIELRDTEKSINENLLINFKYLKKLKINLFRLSNYSDERIKNGLIKILNDKMKLRREIDIYLEGVQIVNMDKFNELIANRFSIWQFRLNNYDLLDLNLPFITQLYYNQLEEHVNNVKNDLPSSFFDKFQNIDLIYVLRVNDVDGLNWVLNNIKTFKALSIDSKVSSLDEIFYNNLPNTIGCLAIYNKEDINYDFILKLSKLIRFHTNANKDLFDLAFKSFLNLKYLEQFGFYFEDQLVKIEKEDKHFYLDSSIEKLDYNQLIVECNKIRSIMNNY